MLEAMDECSIEGYDEHLYAGHAASVYMAAIDAAPVLPQQCYCGDITRLGVVHRADSFCDEKPEQREPTKQEHNILMGALKRSGKFVAQPEQEPVAWMDEDGDVLSASVVSGKGLRNIPLYTTPPQRKPLTHEQRFDLLTKFEPHKNKWEAPAILIDMVEAAHGIKEKA
jgi:hypothetical protein